MARKQHVRLAATLALAGAWLPPLAVHPAGVSAQVLFTDDFEHGLAQWRLLGPPGAAIRASGDAGHGQVLVLRPNGDVVALMRGSESWTDVRIEGEMLFPEDVDDYLGLVYRHATRGERQDFGLIYVKGNDGYLQANPHRDFNVSRTLYPELRTPLAGPSAVVTGQWQRFAIEVVGAAAHVYVGATTVPQMTVEGFEGTRGAFGLQPRSVGGPVWVDRVSVRPIARFSYDGPPVPAPAYDPASLITDWRVAGPFPRTRDALAQRPDDEGAAWRAAAVDRRGAVVTGRMVDYHGPETVAYLRTSLPSATAREAQLELSTVDDLTVWLNGDFVTFVERQPAAWFDVGRTAAHAGRRVPLSLRAGANVVVIRVRGGVYATGGFFARLDTGGER
jgi:hypothetical protein